MNDLQLYINDQLVDLSDDSPIALTFQINNLAEVRNQQGNTSNQFRLPLTQNNRRILGFPDDVAFCTDLPYRKYQAKIVQDGMEIIPYGIGELNSVDNNNANITILSGNVDFFDAIDGKLYDMGDTNSIWHSKLWQQYDHNWNLDSVVQSQQKISGWIWPVIDYGVIGLTDFNQPINVRQLRPGFFLHTAIDLLVKSTGYRIAENSSLVKDDLYKKLIIQFANSNFDHGTDYQNSPGNSGLKTTNYTDQIVSNPRYLPNPFEGQIYFDQPAYTATANVSVNATILFNIFMRGRYTGQPSETVIKFTIKEPDGSINDHDSITFLFDGNYTRLRGSGSGIIGQQSWQNQKLTASFDLTAGQKLFVRYHINNVGTGQDDTYVVFFKDAQFNVTLNQQPVLYDQMVQCERIFPDISQKDLLKDTLQRFGIICQTDNVNRTISLNSFKDIVNNIPIAKNWTKKCLDHGKTIMFQLGNYTQVNSLKYKTDDGVLPIGFADATINVADTTLPAASDLLESQFAPTLNRPYIGGSIAQVKMVDTDSSNTDFSIAVSPRILIDQKLDIGSRQKKVTFTDGNGTNRVVNDIVSTPYFYKPDGEYNLCFGDKPAALANKVLPGLKTKYYAELEKILQQTKKVVRYFLLTPRDILELDFLIPVYLEQDSAYYYINKIDAWRKGQSVKVELVQMG